MPYRLASRSNVFNAIRPYVDRMGWNTNGFTPMQVANAGVWSNPRTIMTFIPKHCHTPVLYFRRVKKGGAYVYFVRDQWMERA